MSLRNYDIAEAAELMRRCFPRFLEDDLKRLPHQEIGAAVAFDDDDLLEIKDMFRVRPASAATPSKEPALALATITPSQGRRRA
ncbi:hypothetical protein ACFVXE_08040 [Streptomyces sp. NPDC058231]|uniref:hypothetical protein n=1 Tax=Streptomyces sp. NPDC058231 TaxID=3346392 RepID=UPI0036E0DD2A